VGGLIAPDARWDLGHADGESVGGPEHRMCNRSAPQRLKAGGGSCEPASAGASSDDGIVYGKVG